MTSSVLVVGAGVTGLVTAIECALAGHRVTVLDRGPIPNPAATSFDQHRALRVLYPDDPAATHRMVAARRRWVRLEAVLGTRFFRRVGIAAAWPRSGLDAVTGAAVAAGVPVDVVEPEKLPHVAFPAGTVAVLETDAGVLLAQRFLAAAAGWLAGQPAVTVRPGCAVTDVDTAAGRVTLAGGAVLGADLVLIAAGPWTRDLVALPVVLHRQTMVYLRPPPNLSTWWEHAPGVGRLGGDGRAWLVPPGDGGALKISTDAACREVDSLSGTDDGAWAARVLAAGILSDVDAYEVLAVRDCHYASTGTGAALLARVGPAVWARPACGGTGFSTAPLVAAEIVEAMMEVEA